MFIIKEDCPCFVLLIICATLIKKIKSKWVNNLKKIYKNNKTALKSFK